MKNVFFTFLFLILCVSANAVTPILDYLIDIEIQNKESGLSLVDCVYVINLEFRSEKWLETNQRLLQYDIHANRVCAVNGWLLTEEDRSSLSGAYPLRLRGGVVGCLLSHISVIRDALNRGFKCIWVCEDDIAIHEDPHQLSTLLIHLNLLEPEWDIFYTDLDSKDSNGTSVPSLSSDFRVDQFHQPLSYYVERTPLTNQITQIRQRFGAYSLIISRTGMEKILNYFKSIYLWTAYDIDIHYIPNIKEFAVNRDIVSIDFTTPSDTLNNFYLH